MILIVQLFLFERFMKIMTVFAVICDFEVQLFQSLVHAADFLDKNVPLFYKELPTSLES